MYEGKRFIYFFGLLLGMKDLSAFVRLLGYRKEASMKNKILMWCFLKIILGYFATR